MTLSSGETEEETLPGEGFILGLIDSPSIRYRFKGEQNRLDSTRTEIGPVVMAWLGDFVILFPAILGICS